jgi:hypothetical protein
MDKKECDRSHADYVDGGKAKDVGATKGVEDSYGVSSGGFSDGYTKGEPIKHEKMDLFKNRM